MRGSWILALAGLALTAVVVATALDGGMADDGSVVVAIVAIVATIGFAAAAAFDHWMDRPVENPHLARPLRAHSIVRTPRCSTCRSPMHSTGSLLVCDTCDRA